MKHKTASNYNDGIIIYWDANLALSIPYSSLITMNLTVMYGTLK